MTKQSKATPQRPAPKTPITQEAVRKVQRRTAANNGGQQSLWTRRLQSVADQRAAKGTDGGAAAGAQAAQRQGSRKTA
jgi:hypothetical protein